MEDGWSIKKLHRRIMLSQTYQQSSDATPEAQLRDRRQPAAFAHEPPAPGFRGHARFACCTSAANSMKTIGGRPVDITVDPSPPRRTIYALHRPPEPSGPFPQLRFRQPRCHLPAALFDDGAAAGAVHAEQPFPAPAGRGVLDRPEVKQDEATDKKIDRSVRASVRAQADDGGDFAGPQFIDLHASIPEAADRPAKLKQLTPWEQYVQVLMESNEFIFVD